MSILPEFETLKSHNAFGGRQVFLSHESLACSCPMRLSVFLPPQAAGGGRLPVLVWLSGLTCTEANFAEKAGAQRYASEYGVIVVAPDTSPRGPDVPDAPNEYDFGQGAGFYLNATQPRYVEHYRMASYVAEELPDLIAAHLPADTNRMGLFGHSMGGHGALTLHLKHPEVFKTCSAFAPIVNPMAVPWGRKAFTRYLGTDETTWAGYDACALVKTRMTDAHILIDQGEADEFLTEQLVPERFEAACRAAGQSLSVRRHPGYDHSYYFIATFIGEHFAHHLREL
ncbi:MAG: S-formylglutathione hydrolase [Maricaulaceae bacterium]